MHNAQFRVLSRSPVARASAVPRQAQVRDSMATLRCKELVDDRKVLALALEPVRNGDSNSLPRHPSSQQLVWKCHKKVFLDAVTKARFIRCLILHWAARPLLESARLALQRLCLPGARACFSEMWNPFLTWPLKVRPKNDFVSTFLANLFSNSFFFIFFILLLLRVAPVHLFKSFC